MRRKVFARASYAVLGTVLAAQVALAQADYSIGTGDVLRIRVWQREDLSGEFTVGYDGTVTLPLVGAIPAAGESPTELGEELTRRYSFVDRRVNQVSVSVVQYKSRRVYVMGQVRQPGTYSFPELPSVWEVIREAGGPLPEAALTRVQIVPPEGEGRPQIADLDRALATGDFSQLPELKPGATILVPRAEALGPQGDFVYVYGNVKNPGIIPYDAAQSVLGAVLAAGGPAADANMGKVRVVRPGPVRARVFEVDLEDYTHEGVLFPNVPLRPGDTVTVPRNTAVAVFRGIGQTARTVTGVVGTLLFFIRLTDDDPNRQGNNQNPTQQGGF